MCRSLGFTGLGLEMSCLCLAKESEFKKWQTPRHLVLASPYTVHALLFLPSPIYLCSSSRATHNLTQYILLWKWNKEVCLQLGLDGEQLLDVSQGLPPLSLWRRCFCFSYVLTDTETGSVLTVWRITQAWLDTNAENMHCVEKQKPWPLAEWHSLVLPPTEVLGK